MTLIALRPAIRADHAAIRACVEAAYTPFRTLDGLPPVADGLDEDIIRRMVRVAVAGEAIAGVAVASRRDNVLAIHNLAVHPDWGRRGLATRLMSRLELLGILAGAAEARLTTHAMMEPTIAFYRHAGWTETGREGLKVSMRKALA